jgi:hypothetical protein
VLLLPPLQLLRRRSKFFKIEHETAGSNVRRFSLLTRFGSCIAADICRNSSGWANKTQLTKWQLGTASRFGNHP